jgi:tRNA 2-selenouridine synthase
MDLSKPIWLEDESRMIGKITLPDPLFEQISTGILIQVLTPLPLRIERLVSEYSCFSRAKLGEALNRLHQRIGGTNTRNALQALKERKYDTVAAIVLSYYDKAYQFAIDRRKNQSIYRIELNQSDNESNAEKILGFYKTLSIR